MTCTATTLLLFEETLFIGAQKPCISQSPGIWEGM
jgi:hypothetical protein